MYHDRVYCKYGEYVAAVLAIVPPFIKKSLLLSTQRILSKVNQTLNQGKTLNQDDFMPFQRSERARNVTPRIFHRSIISI